MAWCTDFRRVLQQIGEPHVKTAFAQPDGRVQRGKAAKAHVQRRDRRARTQCAVLCLEDGDQR